MTRGIPATPGPRRTRAGPSASAWVLEHVVRIGRKLPAGAAGRVHLVPGNHHRVSAGGTGSPAHARPGVEPARRRLRPGRSLVVRPTRPGQSAGCRVVRGRTGAGQQSAWISTAPPSSPCGGRSRFVPERFCRPRSIPPRGSAWRCSSNATRTCHVRVCGRAVARRLLHGGCAATMLGEDSNAYFAVDTAIQRGDSDPAALNLRELLRQRLE